MTIASADPRVLLKIDTQGYDLRVLEGALDYRPPGRGYRRTIPVRNPGLTALRASNSSPALPASHSRS